MSPAETQIRAKVRLVAHEEPSFGTLSAGERIAVTLALDRYDLLKGAWGSMLEAVNRLGPEWTETTLRIQRNGWHDEI